MILMFFEFEMFEEIASNGLIFLLKFNFILLIIYIFRFKKLEIIFSKDFSIHIGII